jgi:hypothetical protein
MACYNPLRGYRAKFVNEDTGKKPIVFKASHSDGSEPIDLPCGKCTGCRLEYSRQWALRCYHEAQLHEHNSFITLTYNNENIPGDLSIHKKELQDFIKRLRKNTGVKLRYFACGEYGEKGRPHYHAIIFGYDFPDRRLWSKTKGGLLFRSAILEKAWQHKGYCSIGNVTFESAAYVARYVMKKRKGPDDQVDPKTGKTNKQYYEIMDPDTGELHTREPEFCIMSRRPGIARDWLKKYKGDTDKDYVTLLNGKSFGLPKYYDKILEKEDPIGYLERKEKRQEKVNPMDNTFSRLRVKEKIKTAQLNQLKRNYEDES